IPPQVGRYSVYIIDEVHMLSQAAFNSFLKTLEEPPAHAIFILCTTEKHKIIPTILSRCQTYDFNRIGIPDIVGNLRSIAAKEGVNVDDASLHIIAQKADGAMRDALTIFDQTVAFCGTDIQYADVIRNLNVLDYEYSFRLTDAFLAKDYGTALLIFDEILSKGFNSLHFISALGSHFRDLLVSRTGGLDSLLDLPDSLRERYREQASRCPVKFLYDALGIISQCEAGYRAATNQRLHIEFALMRIAFLGGMPAEKPVQIDHTVVKQPVVVDKPKVEMPEQAGHDVKAVAPEERKPKKRASGLSLSALMSDEKKEVAEQKEETAGPEKLPEPEVVEAKWPELAAMYTAQPRLSGALATAKLDVMQEDGILKVSFALVSKAQRDWIAEKKLRELEDRFSAILGCQSLRLYPEVLPEEEQEKKIYMPVEKAQDLMRRNSEVNELVKDLALDIR
ncbi:MAG: DNA polymerase III subunit gamma/tau, partial [Bacteroidales bacterium]|nr:DNA polymerase III subunit gamma/tau [Bacteroidales bacterium]